MSLDKEYVYNCNPWVTAYIESGITNNELFKTIIENRGGWGGGFSINYQAINNHTTSKIKEVKDLISGIPPTDLSTILEKLDENESHNEIIKTEIIATIKESEAEICSDVIRKTKEIKEDNVKTRNLVRQKTKGIDEDVSILVDRQELIDKTIEDEADSIEESLDKIYKEEADMIEQSIENVYRAEADEIEKSINISK